MKNRRSAKAFALCCLTLTSVAALYLAMAPTFNPVEAGCQDQICQWTGTCYKCGDSQGFSCIPENTPDGCPQGCFERHCSGSGGGPGDILPYLEDCESNRQGFLLGHRNARAAHKLETAALRIAPMGSQTEPDRPQTQPARIGMLRQTPAPAMLFETLHTATDLLAGGTILNGSRRIIGYRLGWVVDFPGRQPEVQLGDWVSVSVGVPPKGKAKIPSQLVPFSLIERGATRVEFLVAGVVFADGSRWEANLEEIVKIPPAGKP